jgi:hypothetical protein
MKCPKCGYISFDHNEACPKCNKDITDERDNLGLPHFEPSVPYLLGALTGMADDSIMDIEIGAPGSQGSLQGGGMPDREEEEAPPLPEEKGEAVPQDDGLEMSLDEEWSTVAAGGQEEAERVPDSDEWDLDLEDLDLPSEGGEELEPSSLEAHEVGGDEEITFDFEEPQAPEPLSIGPEEDLSLDLEELSLDDEDLGGDIQQDSPPSSDEESELEFDLDSITLEEEDVLPEEPAPPGEAQEELLLNLDDLKINETGELEVVAPAEGAAPDEEKPPPAPKTEGLPEDDSPTLELEGLPVDEEAAPPGGGGEDEFSLDLDDLDLDLDLEEKEPDKSS